MAVLDQPGDDRIAAHTFDRIFASGVDIGDEDDVGVVEAGAKIIEQMRDPGIAMRLHDRDHLARHDRAGRF